MVLGFEFWCVPWLLTLPDLVREEAGGGFSCRESNQPLPLYSLCLFPWLRWPCTSHYRWIIHKQIKGHNMSCLVFSILSDMNHCHVLSCNCPYITSAAPWMDPWAHSAFGSLREDGVHRCQAGIWSEQNQSLVSTLGGVGWGGHWFGDRGLKRTEWQGPGRRGTLAKWDACEMPGSGMDTDQYSSTPTPTSTPRGQLQLSSRERYLVAGGPAAGFRLCQEKPKNWIFRWNGLIFKSW